MKHLLTTLMFIFSFELYGQSEGWNSVVTTGLDLTNFDKAEVYTNKDGNHIVVSNNSTVKYYRYNSSGSYISGTEYTFESSGGGKWANITGRGDVVCVVYRKDNYIKYYKSTNSGGSWSLSSSYDISTSTCEGLDAFYDSDFDYLHVADSRYNNGRYRVYYSRFQDTTPVDEGDVSDCDNTDAKYPSIRATYYNDARRAHITWQLSTNVTRTRDKFYYPGGGGIWSVCETISSYTAGSMIYSTSDDSLYIFYIYDDGELVRIRQKKKIADATSYGTNYLTVAENVDNVLCTVSRTVNNKLNIIYSASGLKHRTYDGAWSSVVSVASGSNFNSLSSSSVSNDIYLIWKDNGSSYMRYCQYDANPLVPQNFSITVDGAGHPKLTWTKNSEPDVVRADNNTAYKIDRRIDSLGTGNFGPWYYFASRDYSKSDFTDESIGSAGYGPCKVEYRIRARDYTSHHSEYSSTVSISYGTGENKIAVGRIYPAQFTLEQNYPNPFNPSTKIRFSIPVNQFNAVLTTLKVYDLLGNIIGTIVNEHKEPGEYEIDFNAEDFELQSGIYFYELRAGNFYSVRKFLLIK